MKASALEQKFAWALKCYGQDLPPHEVEYRFAPPRKWRADFAFPPSVCCGAQPYHKLLVELDGGRWKAGGGKHFSDADYEKINAASRLGWRVLRFTATMLNDSEKVIAEVREALRPSAFLCHQCGEAVAPNDSYLFIGKGNEALTKDDLYHYGCAIKALNLKGGN